MLAVILVVGPFQDALFGFVLIANAGVGIVQELRAKRTLDRLSVLTAPKAHVVRDGEVQEVPVDRVVLDDVLELATGRQVVVDGEVLVSDGLELDESLLTGEPEPVAKRPGDQALSGSFVAAGAGRMVATAVGADAYAVEARVGGQAVHAHALGAARRRRPDPALGDVRDRADRRAAVRQPAAPPRQLAPRRVGARSPARWPWCRKGSSC